jgi:ribosomal protein L12E/L44/L45/RPP1/RPP2
MKHLAAYLLLSLGNKSSPSAQDVKSVLESVGIEADDDRLATLISELKGKDLQEVYRICARSMMFRRLTLDSWSLRVQASWLPFHLEDLAVVLPLPAELLLLVAPVLPKRRRKRRRKRVCTVRALWVRLLLIPLTEKEESDEDMGFGLFD